MPSPFFPDKEGGFVVDTKGAKDLMTKAGMLREIFMHGSSGLHF